VQADTSSCSSLKRVKTRTLRTPKHFVVSYLATAACQREEVSTPNEALQHGRPDPSARINPTQVLAILRTFLLGSARSWKGTRFASGLVGGGAGVSGGGLFSFPTSLATKYETLTVVTKTGTNAMSSAWAVIVQQRPKQNNGISPQFLKARNMHTKWNSIDCFVVALKTIAVNIFIVDYWRSQKVVPESRRLFGLSVRNEEIQKPPAGKLIYKLPSSWTVKIKLNKKLIDGECEAQDGPLLIVPDSHRGAMRSPGARAGGSPAHI